MNILESKFYAFDIFGKQISYFLINILEVNLMFLIKYFGK